MSRRVGTVSRRVRSEMFCEKVYYSPNSACCLDLLVPELNSANDTSMPGVGVTIINPSAKAS